MAPSERHERAEPTETSSRRAPRSLVPVVPFGRYNLVGRLGQGGMAEVYLAYTVGPAGFRKLVVVKRLHRHLENEPGFLEMFLDEARLAARLNHPNVVLTFEVGEVDGAHFISMEHLEGQGLDRIWRRCAARDRRMPRPLVASILVGALDGLHYAHELRDFDGMHLGVVHRDVSPQNVFVTYEGMVKLLDFGVAKAATHLADPCAGAIRGKLAYIAPEQARARAVDRRADVWSMGVVLWESLAGRRLFKAANDLATLGESLTGRVPDLVEVDPTVPEPLARIADRALTRPADERYQTALEMKSDLEDYLGTVGRGGMRSELAAFVRELFADVIEQHRRVLEVCLSDASDAVPSGAQQLASEPAPSEPDDDRAPPKVD